MRASSTATTCVAPARRRASSATASRVSTGSTGTPAPRASPCATAHAVRKPVKEPGPQPKTIASSVASEAPACCSNSMTRGTSAADALGPPSPRWTKGSRPGTASAMLSRSVLVSKARRRTGRNCGTGGHYRCRAAGIIQAMRVLPFLALLFATALASAQSLPPEVEAALAGARVPRDAVPLLVTDVDPAVPPRLSHRADVPVNPASIAKLATTVAALELLGPAYTWSTPVLTDGAIANGTLQGNLYLQGSGDPKLVLERLWLLLRRVRALGIERVSGDI